MIEFRGEQTGLCQRFMFKKYAKVQMITFLALAAFWAIPAILLSTLDAAVANLLSKLLFIAAVAQVILAFIPLGKFNRSLVLSKRIYIDFEEGTIVRETEKEETFRMLSEIRTVLDHGEWYEIVFDFGNGARCYACQKGLLTQGTLEEFELLFEGKIERKFDSPKDNK